MKIVFCLALLCAVLIVPALAEEHSTDHKIGISTELVASEPFMRASISVEKSGWTLTPGVASSEDRKFGFVNLGYRFKRELENGGEVFAEPHVGFAKGNTLGTSAVFGGRMELESHNWLVASWVDSYRGGNVKFTTCEPLAEVARHIGKGFFFGASSSCYIGPANEAAEEKSAHHEAETHTITEHLFFVGPTVMFRHKRILFGASYEVGKGNERIVAGFANFRW
ncbi:MAG: hypothetical protein WC794_02780 [Candidatus Doudnabacteria bacterium]|jgi:hypothetical protein